MIERRTTRQIHVGKVPVGGDAPITVQSMTVTKTADVEGTLQQIYALAAAGCDNRALHLQRTRGRRGTGEDRPAVTDPDRRRHPPPVPDGAGGDGGRVHGLRLNPGNIRKPEHIKAVAAEARDRGIPIRIGVNGGSLDPALYEKYGGIAPEAMVESALQEIRYFQEVDFDQIKISVKASNVPLMVEAYRQLSEVVDHPLHLASPRRARRPPGW